MCASRSFARILFEISSERTVLANSHLAESTSRFLGNIWVFRIDVGKSSFHDNAIAHDRSFLADTSAAAQVSNPLHTCPYLLRLARVFSRRSQRPSAISASPRVWTARCVISTRFDRIHRLFDEARFSSTRKDIRSLGSLASTYNSSASSASKFHDITSARSSTLR